MMHEERLATILSEPIPPLHPVVTVKGKVHYGLQPKQLEFYDMTPVGPTTPPEPGTYPTHIAYGGAAGGAKSHTARAVAVAACLKWPGSTHIIFRKTMPELEENHIVKLRAELPEYDGKLYTFNRNKAVAEFHNGSRLLFGYLKDADDIYRYQGPEYDSMHFEEATHFPFFQVHWLTHNRLRATVKESRPFAAYYSNPGNIGHAWFKRLFVTRRYDVRADERPEDYAFLQAKVWDNYILIHRDPVYVRKLMGLHEPWRSWLLEGDWDAGAGMLLQMLDPSVHLVPPFDVPEHWIKFGAFDWGFAHRWVFGGYAVNEDGRCFKVDTVHGWRMQPNEIAGRIQSRFDTGTFRYIVAGHDLWAKREAYAPGVPSLAEQLMAFGIFCQRASIDRIAGLQSLRHALQHEMEHHEPPKLSFMDTPGNRWCFDQLETMVADPDHPEDALKVNCDELGDGGDDAYDETRYAMASRFMKAKSVDRRNVSSWDPEVLAAGAERCRRSRTPKSERVVERRGRQVVLHPEFGGIF